MTPSFGWISACLSASLLLVACGGPPPSDPAHAQQTRIADLHRAKCGACHRRVEPGTRSKAQLEDAFVRHRKRLVLSEDDWTELTLYLARP